jgi:hypothetical protein
MHDTTSFDTAADEAATQPAISSEVLELARVLQGLGDERIDDMVCSMTFTRDLHLLTSTN